MRVLAGRYELLEKVGEGGMSVVWRARDTRLERDVAVKLLRSFVAIEPEQRRRFAREARTLAALSNDHIVRLYDYAEAGDDAFLVMEFVEGSNLAERTFTRLPLTWSEAAAYARPVCAALAYAHAKDVVHRDLTPANILIERETGRVVTTDFGLARIARSGGSLTTIGTLVGTPEYWSPEQALGRESGSSSDMYALGCILYLLLSGRLPFEGDDRLALGLRRAHEDPLSLRECAPHVPEGAATLVDSLLRRDPSRRPDAPTAALAMVGGCATPDDPPGARNGHERIGRSDGCARVEGRTGGARPDPAHRADDGRATAAATIAPRCDRRGSGRGNGRSRRGSIRGPRRARTERRSVARRLQRGRASSARCRPRRSRSCASTARGSSRTA